MNSKQSGILARGAFSAVVVLGASNLSSQVLAQTGPQPSPVEESGSPSTRSAASPEPANNVNGAILQELEQMRLRIQELEAQLKQSQSAPSASKQLGSAMANNSVNPTVSSTAAQTSSTQQPSAAEPT